MHKAMDSIRYTIHLLPMYLLSISIQGVVDCFYKNRFAMKSTVVTRYTVDRQYSPRWMNGAAHSGKKTQGRERIHKMEETRTRNITRKWTGERDAMLKTATIKYMRVKIGLEA